MSNFLSEPAISLIITASKAVARINGSVELNARFLLGGVLVVIEDAMLEAISSELEKRREVIASAVGGITLIATESISDGAPMPLAREFRQIMEQYAEADVTCLPSLLDDCIASIDEQDKEEAKKFKRRIVEMDKGAEYAALLGLASKIGKFCGSDVITIEALAAAVWRGHDLGFFDNRPGLAAHMDAYFKYFAIMLRQDATLGAIESDCACDGDEAHTLPFSDEINDHEPNTHDAVYALVMLGTHKVMKADTRRRAAMHEAGHGVAFALLRPDIRIKLLSVKDRRESAGLITIDFDQSTNPLMNYSDGIFQHVVCLLAGRSAETAAFGPTGTNSGARSDLENATSLIWEAIAEEGLSAQFGPIHLPTISKKVLNANALLIRQAEELLQVRMKLAQDTADIFVKEHFELIRNVADELDIRGELAEDDVRRIISHQLRGPGDRKLSLAA